MGICLSKKELANAAGYSYRQLHSIDQKLKDDEKLFVEGEGGKYDLALFVQRWVEYNLSKERDGDETLDDVKAAHEKIKTRKTELEVQKLEGELVSVYDVMRLWGDIAGSVVQNMLRLPSSIAPQVAGMESIEKIIGIIDEEIRKVLELVADTPLPDYAAAVDDTGEE
ncbi:MAG: hypothetical protein IJ466_07260 [Clostridia bacterium]|nr:hypothetical protein [Clostridia bacterium]